ncbi:MAG TPA: methylaspartate mutase subunit S [Clostridia bacterium]|nr:methylaspartate mutase subunit S [Clostridia bacterium]
MESNKKKLVIGVIGADVHAVGNKILDFVFSAAGFDVINLGVMVPQEDFINAALEADADAIVVSSLYGHGELDCRGLRDRCIEAGIGDILLYVGGNIVVGKQDFEDVEKRFIQMGFNRVFGPGTPPEAAIAALSEDLHIS